jgi:hypothetical protein
MRAGSVVMRSRFVTVLFSLLGFYPLPAKNPKGLGGKNENGIRKSEIGSRERRG